MIKTVSLHDFRTEWALSQSRGTSFSYEGLEILYDFLEEVEPDHDLDIVALDSAYAESDLEDLIRDYGYAMDEEDEEELTLENFADYIGRESTVLGITSHGTIVYLQF
jgi:hypothetical protein